MEWAVDWHGKLLECLLEQQIAEARKEDPSTQWPIWCRNLSGWVNLTCSHFVPQLTRWNICLNLLISKFNTFSSLFDLQWFGWRWPWWFLRLFTWDKKGWTKMKSKCILKKLTDLLLLLHLTSCFFLGRWVYPHRVGLCCTGGPAEATWGSYRPDNVLLLGLLMNHLIIGWWELSHEKEIHSYKYTLFSKFVMRLCCWYLLNMLIYFIT